MPKMHMLEQHIHGAFGVDFNTTNVDGVLYVAQKLYERGIIGFFPTLVTDSIENIKRQISIIKEASKKNHRILWGRYYVFFITCRDCFVTYISGA